MCKEEQSGGSGRRLTKLPSTRGLSFALQRPAEVDLAGIASN